MDAPPGKSCPFLPDEIVDMIVEQVAVPSPDPEGDAYDKDTVIKGDPSQLEVAVRDDFAVLKLSAVNRAFYHIATSRFWSGSTWTVFPRIEIDDSPETVDWHKGSRQAPALFYHRKPFYREEQVPLAVAPYIQRMHLNADSFYDVIGNVQLVKDNDLGVDIKEEVAAARLRFHEMLSKIGSAAQPPRLDTQGVDDVCLGIFSTVKHLSIRCAWRDSVGWENRIRFRDALDMEDYCETLWQLPELHQAGMAWDRFLDVLSPSLESVRILREHPADGEYAESEGVHLMWAGSNNWVTWEQLWNIIETHDRLMEFLINLKIAERRAKLSDTTPPDVSGAGLLAALELILNSVAPIPEPS